MTPNAGSLVATLGLAVAACGGATSSEPDASPGPPLLYGGDRQVELQRPSPIEPGQTYPLFLILHGYGATAFTQQAYFGLGLLRSDPGAFVLAPDGTVDSGEQQFWNASPACCDFAGTGVDDVAYLGGLIDDVMADWPVDPTRVFVIGHSNGGFMAFRLACERADVVTAVADLAGANISVDGAGCTPSQPVHVLHLHGTSDEVVGYDGGVLVTAAFPGAEATVDHWAGYNGCGESRALAAPLDLIDDVDGAETVPENAQDCPADGAVALWRMDGGPHVPAVDNNFSLSLVDWLMTHPR